MSVSPDNLWKLLEDFDNELLVESRLQLHQAVQKISAVGRTFLPSSEQDLEAVLEWLPDMQLMAGKWVKQDNQFRFAISPENFIIHLIDSDSKSISSIDIKDLKPGEIMLWMEEQLSAIGLDGSRINLNRPYELSLPSPKRRPFKSDKSSAKVLSEIYHNAWLVLTQMTEETGGFSDVRIFPHHFDIAAQQIVKDTGDPETSANITIGLSPGDENFLHPYFYVTVWPYASTENLSPLTTGYWYEDAWMGAVMKVSLVNEETSASNQHRVVLEFIKEAFGFLKKTIK